jgi:hypothetical protein
MTKRQIRHSSLTPLAEDALNGPRSDEAAEIILKHQLSAAQAAEGSSGLIEANAEHYPNLARFAGT